MVKKRKVHTKTANVTSYKLLTLDEVNAMEQRYMNRADELRVNAIQIFSEALNECHRIDDNQREVDVWNAYVNCDHIPKPYLTTDMRKFLTKQYYEENKLIEKNIDWILSIDDRSLLNQNIFRNDMSRETMLRTIKPDFGKDYVNHIDDTLTLIKRIDYYLNNPSDWINVDENIINDIISMKSMLHEDIKDTFNRYTYRILCNEVAYMNSIDATSVEYSFSCKNFAVHIWSLRRVPIRFTHISEPRMIANLYNLKLTIHIPLSLLRLNLTIQGVHMKFDIFTEYVTSFKAQNEQISYEESNNSTFKYDLSQCLLNEWMQIRNMQEIVRENLLQLRQNYEEIVRAVQEAQEKEPKMAKEKNENVKKPKATKLKIPAVAPQLLGQNDYPDVYEDFIKEDNARYKRYLDANYNPKHLNLQDDEINMKQYAILGGVYQLFCVEKPQHYDFNFSGFNMTTHSPHKKLIVDTQFFIPLESTERLSRSSTKYSEPLAVAPKSLMVGEEIDPTNPWIVLTFELSEDLCLWGDPIACHYEITEIEKTEEEVRKSLISHSLFSKIARDKSIFHDNNEIVSEKSKLNLDVARKPATFLLNFSSVEPDKEGVPFIPNVKDFALNRIYDLDQTTFIKQFCVPQIVPSYKFAREINEELFRRKERKPKGKTGILLSKKTVKPVERSNAIFSYDDKQNNPECLFPVQIKEEKYNMHDELEPFTNDLPHEPKTFYQLVKVITLIKNRFQSRPYQIVNELSQRSSAYRLNSKDDPKSIKAKYEFNELPTKLSIATVLSERHSVRPSMRHSVRYTKLSNSITTSRTTKRPTGTTSRNNPSFAMRKKDSAEKKEVKQTIPYTKWTTRHIKDFQFIKEKSKYIIQTDCLGYIGFAFKRYVHFPFKYWDLQPSQTDPQNEVIFTLETQFVKCILKVTGEGISGYVTDISKKYVRNPKMYLVIDEPIRDYIEFKKRFKDNNLNIFADDDAGFYIENGNFSEKHMPLELHTYSCMAIYCSQVKFNHSIWNALSDRRDIVLEFVGIDDIPDNKVTVRLTPEQASFVEITELCTLDLNTIKLQFKPTWRNMSNYGDLHHMLISMYPNINEYRCKNAKIMCYLRNLLTEIRPFSFS